jgi:transposase-like protein
MTPPKTSKHSPEVRAAAIAALLAGQSVSAVAKEYNLPKGTVSNWKNHGPVQGGSDAKRTQKATERIPIGELLNTLVEENLKALIAGARLTQDLTWLRTQGATEVGTLLGITCDKTVRMLEAMAKSRAEAEGESGNGAS